MKELKIERGHFKIGDGRSCITTVATERGETFLTGYINTFWGPVGILYSQGDDRHRHSTQIEFQIDQTVHTMRINRRFTQRGLATRAKRFAKEVTEEWERGKL